MNSENVIPCNTLNDSPTNVLSELDSDPCQHEKFVKDWGRRPGPNVDNSMLAVSSQPRSFTRHMLLKPDSQDIEEIRGLEKIKGKRFHVMLSSGVRVYFNVDDELPKDTERRTYNVELIAGTKKEFTEVAMSAMKHLKSTDRMMMELDLILNFSYGSGKPNKEAIDQCCTIRKALHISNALQQRLIKLLMDIVTAGGAYKDGTEFICDLDDVEETHFHELKKYEVDYNSHL